MFCTIILKRQFSKTNGLMAKSVARFDGKPPRTRQMEFDMFWKEFEAIEPTIQDSTPEEEEPVNGKIIK